MIITVDSHLELMPITLYANGVEVKKATYVDLNTGEIECLAMDNQGNLIPDGLTDVKIICFYASEIKAFDKHGNLMGEYNA